MPATKSVVYIRNYTADDNTQRTIQGNTYVSASDASFAVPSGMEFVSWNTSRDGTGTAYVVGAAVVATTVYAIWESIPDPIPYITTDTELTSIANAIRTKGGTSAALTYPAGFVSAIEAISTTPTLQSKTAYPIVSSQIVNPDSGYDGLSQVTIDAIPPLTSRLSAVSNHSVTVTPTITDHYSAQHSGSPVTISASDLVSGTLTITENGTADVTNYANALVNVDSGGGVETAHIYADLSIGGHAYYTDANGNLGTETVDYNMGMVLVDDYAPVGSLVVFYAIPMPMAAPTGMSLVGQVSTQKMNLAYVYQVVG